MNKKIECTFCDNPEPFVMKPTVKKYDFGGLPYITLVNILGAKCPQCGEEYFHYPKVDGLNEKIAEILLNKGDLLTGQEIRFLRTFMGYSSESFAHWIGYDPKSFSRLENGHNKVTQQFDRLVRYFVNTMSQNRSYDFHDAILRAFAGKGVNYKRLECYPNKSGNWQIKAA